MANHDSGAQRYNKRMDKIFDRAKAEGRGLVGDSKMDNHGVNSPAMKAARKTNMAKKMYKHTPLKSSVMTDKEYKNMVKISRKHTKYFSELK